MVTRTVVNGKTLFTGTSVAERIFGTNGDDIVTPGGVPAGSGPGVVDFLSGRGGADWYVLWPEWGALGQYVIADRGRDGARDKITGIGGMGDAVNDAVFSDTIERVGGDLHIRTDGIDLVVKGQYRGIGVEEITFNHAGGAVTLEAMAGPVGGATNDLLVGRARRDVLKGNDGDDWLFGNGGNDVLRGGNGNDLLRGGDGRDTLVADAGDDTLHGDAGNDRMFGGAGNDTLSGGAGDDLVDGGTGDDWLRGGEGNDTLRGLGGADVLNGGLGDDRLIGGKGADTYVFDLTRPGGVGTPLVGWGSDRIEERGNPSNQLGNTDMIELRGLYGPTHGQLADALARIDFTRVGNDLVLSVDGGLADITMVNQLSTNSRFFVETMQIDAGYWNPYTFFFRDANKTSIGEDRDSTWNEWSKANEVLIGTDAGEQIFGNTGHNFILSGGGADTFIYKANEPIPFNYASATVSHDIILDFDITQDRFDFTELGITMADLTISTAADGDAQIAWDSGSIEVADIFIELRGVAAADLTADMFLF